MSNGFKRCGGGGCITPNEDTADATDAAVVGPPGDGAANGEEGDGEAELEAPGGCGVRAAGGGPSMENTLISS